MSAWVLLITVCINQNCKVFIWDEIFKGRDDTACNEIKKKDIEALTMKYYRGNGETHMKCVQASTSIEAWKR